MSVSTRGGLNCFSLPFHPVPLSTRRRVLGSFSIEGPIRMSRITVDRPPSRSVGAAWGRRVKLRGVNFGELGGRQAVSEKREAGLAGVKVGGCRAAGWRPHSVSCLFFSLSPTWASLTPSRQVAVIAGNFELGELIRNHREQDVGERAKGRSWGPCRGGAWWDGESADLIWGPGWDQINLRGP